MMPLSRVGPLVCAALVLASCGAAPTQTAPPGGDLPPSDELAQVLRELNTVRARARMCGGQTPGEEAEYFAATTPVTWNARLAIAAQAHAQDMARRNYFAHDSPEGSTLKHRVEAAGYLKWRELGENIAGGYAASEVIEGWLGSKAHCGTLMDPLLREVGMAVVTAPSIDNDLANYWVQDFGTR